MAKLAFLAAVLVALVALSVAEEYSTLQLQCQRELQESSLDPCRQVVNHQLAVQLPFFLPRSSQLRTGVQVQCCQQLQDISRECRAAAIRQIVRPYEHQALVPLRDDPYYPGEDEEEQGGSYYPGETYPQEETGWEQQQGQGRQAFPQQHEQWWRQQQQGQGSYQPSQTYRPQQHQQESYRPSQTSQEQQEQGWYRPSETYRPQQHQESYRPSQTSQEQQEQGWYRPSQTYQRGSYRPSQTYRPQQHQQGSYRPSQTFPQQQQQEGGFYGQSTAHQQQQQQQQQGRQEPYRLRITIYRPARQPTQHELDQTMRQEGQGQYCGRQSQQTGFGRFSSPPRSGTEQQVARLRVVAKARQVAAQLPAMCRLQSSAFSTGEY